MSTAKREGGLYFVNGKAVDANGEPVKGAPKQAPDTDPSKQPGALGVAADPVTHLVNTLASALGAAPAAARSAPAAAPSAPDASDEDDGSLPTVAELPEYLATIDSVEELEALRTQDPRKTAREHYDARIAELRGE